MCACACVCLGLKYACGGENVCMHVRMLVCLATRTCIGACIGLYRCKSWGTSASLCVSVYILSHLVSCTGLLHSYTVYTLPLEKTHWP